MKGPQVLKYIKAIFSASEKLTREQLADGNSLTTGSLIEYYGTLEQGDIVYLVDQAGNVSLLPDGNYPRKSGGTFVIEDGTVSSVSDSPTKMDSKGPIAQAQSNQEPEMEIKETVETPIVEQPKETAVELAADAIAAVPTVDVSDLIDQKLSPLFVQMEQLRELIASQILTLSTETKTALSKVSDEVKLMANEPAGKPIEKEINTFSGPAKEIKDHKALKYFQA